MPVKISKDLCIDCGACIGVCPTAALELGDDGKVTCVEAACIDCDVCIASCPTEAITH